MRVASRKMERGTGDDNVPLVVIETTRRSPERRYSVEWVIAHFGGPPNRPAETGSDLPK